MRIPVLDRFARAWTVAVVALGLMAAPVQAEPAAIAKPPSVALARSASAPVKRDDIHAKIARLDFCVTDLDGLRQIFGEPSGYPEGRPPSKDRLPARKWLNYPHGLSVFLRDGRVRVADVMKPGIFPWANVQVGSSADELFEAIGSPIETVDGKSVTKLRNGVLYKDYYGFMGSNYYYRREDLNASFFVRDGKVTKIEMFRVPVGLLQRHHVSITDRLGDDIGKKIAKLQERPAARENVIRIFGEPVEYSWGSRTLNREKLPHYYFMIYPGGLSIYVYQNRVYQLRFRTPGYRFRGKVEVGSSLEEVLAAVQEPQQTVVGQKNEEVPGVLYKDIDGVSG